MIDFSEAYPDTCSSVGIAARDGDLGLLQDLIWQGGPCDVRDNRGWTPLHEAAFHGHSGCLDLLLRQESTDVSWKTFEEETPLLLAARGGHLECAKALLEHDADVNASTNEGFSPLWEAVHTESLQCVRCLLRRGADINHAVFTGYTPLHLAAEKGYDTILAYLIGHGARLDITADYQLTPIFLAAQFGHNSCLRLMLKVARDKDQLDLVNKPTTDNATPLLIAAQEGHEECIKMLLSCGADANVPITEYKAVAAHFAIYKDHPRCLQLLLPVTSKESLFDNVHLSMHPLILSLQLDNTTCLEILIAGGMNVKAHLTLDPDSIGNSQDTKLFFQTLNYQRQSSILCHIGYTWPLKGVEFLLRAGLPCNPEEKDEIPALLMAISRGASELFTLLLKYGAKPNIYHPKVRGNLVALLSLKTDLRCQNIVTDTETGTVRNLYARYTSRLVVSGGEMGSCIRPFSGQGNMAMYDFYDVLRQCTALNNIFPVLTFLFIFSCNIPLEDDLIHLALKPEWIQFFTRMAASSHSLAHACRKSLIVDFVSKKCYRKEVIQNLPLPRLLQDYLLLVDTELGDGLSEMIMDSFSHQSMGNS